MSESQEPIQQEIELYRDGSGGEVAIVPDELWFENMRKAYKFNYAQITVVLQTQPSRESDYNKIPGCKVLFYPGNREGKLADDEMVYDQPPAQLAKRHGVGGAFGFITNYDDLEKFRDALTIALQDMKRRTKK